MDNPYRLDDAPVLAKESVDARRAAPSGLRSSTLISQSIDGGREIQRDLVQCCHCGRHWQWLAGSGRIRSRCLRCNGITCGPTCPVGERCIPVEKTIEMMEAGIAWHMIPHAIDSEPVSVSVPSSPGGVLLG